MLTKKYKSKVFSLKNYFEGIYTVEFAPDLGKYKYLPGQFLHVALDDEYDGIGQWPESRCFSMQSAPGQKTIKITYAVKGDFTKKMEANLKVGAQVWLKLPYGDLFQQIHNTEKTIFIAGGTGITPYLSLINHDSFKNYENPKLYLGFKSKAYNIYQHELSNSCNKELAMFSTYEDTEGRLNINNIFNENGINASYFISGPPSMIKVFKQKLIIQGVSESNILTDDWE